MLHEENEKHLAASDMSLYSEDEMYDRCGRDNNTNRHMRDICVIFVYIFGFEWLVLLMESRLGSTWLRRTAGTRCS